MNNSIRKTPRHLLFLHSFAMRTFTLFLILFPCLAWTASALTRRVAIKGSGTGRSLTKVVEDYALAKGALLRLSLAVRGTSTTENDA